MDTSSLTVSDTPHDGRPVADCDNADRSLIALVALALA